MKAAGKNTATSGSQLTPSRFSIITPLLALEKITPADIAAQAKKAGVHPRTVSRWLKSHTISPLPDSEGPIQRTGGKPRKLPLPGTPVADLMHTYYNATGNMLTHKELSTALQTTSYSVTRWINGDHATPGPVLAWVNMQRCFLTLWENNFADWQQSLKTTVLLTAAKPSPKGKPRSLPLPGTLIADYMHTYHDVTGNLLAHAEIGAALHTHPDTVTRWINGTHATPGPALVWAAIQTILLTIKDLSEIKPFMLISY